MSIAEKPKQMRRSSALGAALSIVFLAACATSVQGGDENESVDARVLPTDAPKQIADSNASTTIASECPANQFATGFDENGLLVCAAIDLTTKNTFNEQCSVFFGWRDSCDGCTTTPSKWGKASSESCTNGLGVNNSCTTPSLGGESISLFGLNLDGEANGDDKFYVGFQCNTPTDTPIPGECARGSFLTKVGQDTLECVTGQRAISSYVHDHCSIFLGWRDSCNGCTTIPTKWGFSQSVGCANGTGVANTCTSPVLSGDTVHLFGLNTDGEVNDDDKFHLGFQCTGAVDTTGAVDDTCPEGQLIVGILANGTIQCASPEPEIEATVRSGCHIYFGWRDACDGCTTTPSKWGRVSHNGCENGLGANNTCTSQTLGGVSVPMFGLNTDGNVNDDDKFYVGMKCN